MRHNIGHSNLLLLGLFNYIAINAQPKQIYVLAVYLTQEADIIFIALGDSVKLGKAQVDFSFCSP